MNKLLLLGLLLNTSACQSNASLQVRSDRAPLDRRVVLPSDTLSVRWVAVPAFTDSGWLEAPEKPYNVYAFVAQGSAASQPGTARIAVLPGAVARAILPQALSATARWKGESVELPGTAPLAPITVKEAGVALKAATQVDGGVLVQLFLSGGS